LVSHLRAWKQIFKLVKTYKISPQWEQKLVQWAAHPAHNLAHLD
jgi:hypothetical protein